MELTAKAEKALRAILSSPTLAEAAKAAGCSERAIYLWKKEPTFSAALAEARRELLAHAVTRLAALAGEAAEALQRNLTCGRPAAEIRSAVAVLEQARAGVELLDLAARLEALEARLVQQDPRPNGKAAR